MKESNIMFEFIQIPLIMFLAVIMFALLAVAWSFRLAFKLDKLTSPYVNECKTCKEFWETGIQPHEYHSDDSFICPDCKCESFIRHT